MRVLLAVNFEVEAALLPAIISQGHEIVDRVTGAQALAESVGAHLPQVVVVQASPETLTAESLSVCDRSGARTIAVFADSYERGHAASLGIVDRVDARDGWAAIEARFHQGSPVAGDGTHAAYSAPMPAPIESENRAPSTHPLPPDHAPPELSRRAQRQQRTGRRNTPSKRRNTRPSAPVQDGHGGPAQPALPPMPHTGVGPAVQSGRMIAVWGPHGAPGRTTCAIAVATGFAKLGARTVLLDADTYGGAVAQMLGVTDEAPGIAAACRLAAAGALDAHELDRIASPVRGATGTVRVISGITNPARWPELSRERMVGVIEQLRRWADVIVVDVGFSLEQDEELMSDITAPRRNAAAHVLLERADLVVAIGEATPVGLQRLLRGRQQLLPLVADPSRVRVVANRVRRGMHGMDTAAQVAEVLRRFGGIDHVLMLPDDVRACDRAITETASVCDVAPRSALAKQYASLVDSLHAELQRSPLPVT